MSNIYNHNRLPFTFKIDKSEYWDFFLSQSEMCSSATLKGLQTRCLSTYVNLDNPECVTFDNLYSDVAYSWESAVNKGLTLNNIGYTGMDNGYISFQKDRTSNATFYKLFKESSLKIEEDDTRLHLHKVNGNNQIYDYTNDLVEEDNSMAVRLKGGFYQGFFKTDCDYQILPSNIGKGLQFELTLKKSDLSDVKPHTDLPTLNDIHPDNEGIFLYIGTRAENKWYKKYDVSTEFDISCNNFFADGYVKDEYTTTNCLNSAYFTEHEYDKYVTEEYFSGGYLTDECKDSCKTITHTVNNSSSSDVQMLWKYPEALNTYQDNTVLTDNKGHVCIHNELKTTTRCCGRNHGNTIVEKMCSCNSYFGRGYVNEEYFANPCNDFYVQSEYYVGEQFIDIDEVLMTKEGHNTQQPNVIEFYTDNKFILFDKTVNGVTTKTYEEGDEALVSYIKIPERENYFLLFDKTKNGYTTKTIHEYEEKQSKKYNVLKDLYRNALGFQIDKDGKLGYKFLIKDCDSEEEQYKIESEFTKYSVIEDNKWYTIDIKIIPVGRPLKKYTPQTGFNQKMKILFYVNGRLRFMSKQLPMLNLKQLDDMLDKQEGVPYNISIGGGTQGLCDVINSNFREEPHDKLPLENEFAGTFIGYMKSFKIYTCPLNYEEIKANNVFEGTFYS